MKLAKKLNVKNLSIITWDYESVENIDNLEIKFVPLWKWLFYYNLTDTLIHL